MHPRFAVPPSRQPRRPSLAGLVMALWLGVVPGLAILAIQGDDDPLWRDAVAERLRQRLEAAGLPARIEVGTEVVHADLVLPSFYEKRLFQPAWVTGRRRLEELLTVLRAAGSHGLDPASYHLETLEELVASSPAGSPSERLRRSVDLELLATDAFLTYGTHLVAGRVNPETFDPEWRALRREVDLEAALVEAIGTGEIRRVLESLLPRQSGYGDLRRALRRYRTLASLGPWPLVPDGDKLERGVSDPRVRALAERLAATGDLPKPPRTGAEAQDGSDVPVFDEALEAGVRRFQERHGLEPDGVVGPKTLAALNVPAESRVRQIELNLERWRWLPRDLGERYLLVDIPAFSLDLVEGEAPVLSMRVVVGRPYRRTPVFSDQVRYLVLNPSWEVPHKLAVQDKLPEIRKDPEYLRKMGIRVFEGWGADQREVDPATVDWSQITRGTFRYRLRQDPGPLNALGRIKLMFPNKYNVYLHDTPSRELFTRAERSFSSGCIRIEKPLELAVLLLDGDWDRAALEKALAAGSERTVPLPRPVPVHLLYWTAAADAVGTVRFRTDVYDRDRLLDQALTAASASTSPAL